MSTRTSRPAARSHRDRPVATRRRTSGERWRRTWSGRRIGPLPLGVMVAWEAALALLVLCWWITPALVVVGAIVLAAVAVLTLVRVGQRPLWRQARVRRAYRARRRDASRPPRSEGFPMADHEQLVPLLHLAPELRVDQVEGRSGDPAAVVGDGEGFTAVLAPDGESMVPAFQPVSVGVGVLADLCDTDGCDFDSAQLVVSVVPADSQPDETDPALAESYAEVNVHHAPRSVGWLVAVRVDPRVSARAKDIGDRVDVRRLVRSSANRATKTLGAAGLSARMLQTGELTQAFGALLLADRRRPRKAQARLAESSGQVAVDGLSHTCAWVRGLGDDPSGLSRLLALLAELPVHLAVASLVVTVTEQRRLRVSAYVRLVADTSEQSRAALRRLRRSASSAGLGLVPLTAEQAPGLLATVPLGGEVV